MGEQNKNDRESAEDAVVGGNLPHKAGGGMKDGWKTGTTRFSVFLFMAFVVIVGIVIFNRTGPEPPPPPPPPPPITLPTTEQLNDVLRGMRSLVEAQDTYYIHVKKSEFFANSIKELGNGKEPGGTVMLLSVWNADYDGNRQALNGYFYKIVDGDKNRFTVIAIPADKAVQDLWPWFITVVENNAGGRLSRLASDTWQVSGENFASVLKSIISGQEGALADLYTWSPDQTPSTIVITGFHIK